MKAVSAPVTPGSDVRREFTKTVGDDKVDGLQQTCDPEESLVERVMHKVFQWTSQEDGNSNPETPRRKLSTSILETEGRSRSNTLEPTKSPRRLNRRYSCSGSIRSAPRHGSVESTNDGPSSEHQQRLADIRHKYSNRQGSFLSPSSANDKPRRLDVGRKTSLTHTLRPSTEAVNENSSEHEREARSVGYLDTLKRNLLERGERVSVLEDQSESLKISSRTLSKSAHLLAEKYKNKKWYEW